MTTDAIVSSSSTVPRARAIAVFGTASDVGKSLVATALCRILRDAGMRVAPFKAQNMSSTVADYGDGQQMAWSQALQADAAGVVCHHDMNPILLKPRPGMRSEVYIRGRSLNVESAATWMRKVPERFGIVEESYDALAAQYDVIVIEGAGSAAEINLWETDLVNWRTARYADAAVLIVGDIARGGVFAQLLGTLDLLPEHDRARVAGLIVNQFIGDRSLFDNGVVMIEERGGKPVLGVLPVLEGLDFIGEGREASIARWAEHVRAFLNLDDVLAPLLGPSE